MQLGSNMSVAAGVPCLASSRSTSMAMSAQQPQAVTPRRRLEVAACHRCVVRQLIRRPPPATPCSSSNSSSSSGASSSTRGLTFAATGRRCTKTQPDAEAAAAAEAAEAADLEAPGGGGNPAAVDSTRSQQPPAGQLAEEEKRDSAGVKAALAMLRFYKSAISPLMQPACRFQPTCSGACLRNKAGLTGCPALCAPFCRNLI